MGTRVLINLMGTRVLMIIEPLRKKVVKRETWHRVHV